MSLPPDTARQLPAMALAYDGAALESGDRAVAVELPLGLVYGGLPHVVLMATPADLEDLALGFSLTEGVIRTPEELRGFRVEPQPPGLALHMELAGVALSRLLARRRSMVGRTGCGICGLESLDQLSLARPVAQGVAIAPQAFARALTSMPALQELNARTGGVHAAGWFDAHGAALLLREDVGRHNALDKMIGAALRLGLNPQEGFAVITSRCSFEMVEKTAVFGASTLVSISAPTTLAVERAQVLGLRLVGLARADGALQFAGTHGDET